MTQNAIKGLLRTLHVRVEFGCHMSEGIVVGQMKLWSLIRVKPRSSANTFKSFSPGLLKIPSPSILYWYSVVKPNVFLVGAEVQTHFCNTYMHTHMHSCTDQYSQKHSALTQAWTAPMASSCCPLANQDGSVLLGHICICIMWIPSVAVLRYSVYPWIHNVPHCCTLDIWAPKTCNPTVVAFHQCASTWIADLVSCCTLTNEPVSKGWYHLTCARVLSVAGLRHTVHPVTGCGSQVTQLLASGHTIPQAPQSTPAAGTDFLAHSNT